MSVVRGIYGIQHRASQRMYIGSTTCLSRRWSQHRTNLRRGGHSNKSLQAAWNHYGEAAFDFVILETVPSADLVDREQSFIDRYPDCYNHARTAADPVAAIGAARDVERDIEDAQFYFEWAEMEIRREWAVAGRTLGDRYTDAGERFALKQQLLKEIRVRADAIRHRSENATSPAS